ncbi:MAG: response regulator [Chloroflexi bacterium]|nr:response regulator [Chloroflexota bacterium]
MNAKRHVLVVDDEPAVLRFIKAGLTLAGYDVTTTASGEEALELVRSRKPDIMLLDILMVPLDGLQVLDRLRAFSKVPVIVFTARSNIAEESLKLGANGFIAKPFRPDELLKKIEDVLAKAGG